MALERGATTLALNRLAERDRETLERQTHRTLLTGIIEHEYATPQEVHLRAKALGVPLDGRSLVGVVVRLRTGGRPDSIEGQAKLRRDSDVVAEAVRSSKVKALVGALRSGEIGVLVSMAKSERAGSVLQRLAVAVHDTVRDVMGAERPALVAAGSVVASVGEARRSFREAEQVAIAAPEPRDGRAYAELPDVRLRGLLHLMRDDVRLQTFVERELAPLLDHPELVAALSAYLSNGRNVSAAAEASYLSRPSFYERLRRIENVLGVDLDDVEVCVSLHVALLALEAIRRG
jgi:purine catabolism regulator